MVTHTYEVVPTGWTPEQGADGLRFEPFLIDIPAPDHTEGSEARSARRAYFTVLAHLSGTAEPEEFQVFDWTESFGRGLERGPDGLKKQEASA